MTHDLQVGVPALSADGFAEAGSVVRLGKVCPDYGGALETWHMRHLRVDFDFAVVLAQLELLLRAQILVAEEDNAPLGDQQRKLISLLVGKVFELEADNLGTDVCGQVLDFLRRREQSCFLFVGASARIDVFTVFVADGVDVLQEERAGRAILPSC